jgi:hypothetical protein
MSSARSAPTISSLVYPKVDSVAALTSTMRPSASMVMMQSKAALRIALLRASLSRTASCALQRSTNCPICEPRLVIVASRSSSVACGSVVKNSIAPRTARVPRIGTPKAVRSPARAAAPARGRSRRSRTSSTHAGSPLRHTRPGRTAAGSKVASRLARTNASAATAGACQAQTQRSSVVVSPYSGSQ